MTIYRINNIINNYLPNYLSTFNDEVQSISSQLEEHKFTNTQTLATLLVLDNNIEEPYSTIRMHPKGHGFNFGDINKARNITEIKRIKLPSQLKKAYTKLFETQIWTPREKEFESIDKYFSAADMVKKSKSSSHPRIIAAAAFYKIVSEQSKDMISYRLLEDMTNISYVPIQKSVAHIENIINQSSLT